MLRIIENVHQATLVPELLSKKDGEASVHLSAESAVLSDDGKVYPESGGRADVHEHDLEIVNAARALLALIAEKRSNRANAAVRIGGAVVEPKAG